MRFVFIIFICCCALSAAHSQSLANASAGGLVGIRGAVLGFHDETQRELVAVVRVARVYKDYERKGFFRIGVLPIVAMDDVSLEIPDPARAVSGFSQLHHWLCSYKRNIELHRLKIQVGTCLTNRLECTRVLVSKSGEWELTEGVNFLSASNRMCAPRAILQVIGEETGRLTLYTSPPQTNNLFIFSQLDHSETTNRTQ